MDQFYEYDVFCDARRKMNYYKGEILPFINKLCRKDMTSGDIDGFVWDYYKKTYIVIEQKWTNEKNKDSQDLHLKFLSAVFEEASKSERFADYKFYVLKFIGDPPFRNCNVTNITTGESKTISREVMIDLFDMKIKFEDI